MKMLGLAAAAVAMVIAGQASAGLIYMNGPNDVDDDQPFGPTAVAADTFNAVSGEIAQEVTFLSITPNGDVPETIEWKITSGNPFLGGNTVLGSGTATIVSSFDELLPANALFSVDTDTIRLPNVTLTGGNYWLELGFATDSGGDNSIFWVVNDGPSTAWNNVFKLAHSDAFSVLGQVPEPATWALVLAGFASLGAALRSRRSGLASSVQA